MECERCGTTPPADAMELFDYCANCSKNMCPDCMQKGCCGHQPAESGHGQDHNDEGVD